MLTVKSYLSQAFVIHRMLNAKESSIQRLRDRQEQVSAVLSDVKVQTSNRPDPMAEVTAVLLDMIEEYRRDILRLLEIEREIRGIIDRVKRDDYRLILTERYINLKRWEDIAEDNNYSWKWVHVLHGRALKSLEEYMEVHSLDRV